MITKMKLFIAWIKKIVSDGFLAFLKDTVKGKITTIAYILLGLSGTMVATNPGMLSTVYRTITSDPQAQQTIQVLHEEIKQLRGEWKSAEQTNYFERRQFQIAFKAFAEMTDRNFKLIHDSLIRQNKRLASYQQGQGIVDLTGGGEVVAGTFSDDWLDAYVEADPNGDIKIDYVMNFKVKDIALTYEDDTDGSRKEIYAVKLQSLKDSTVEYNVGNYERWVTTFAEAVKPDPQIVEQHSSLNLNVGYSGYGAELGVSYSIWTLGNFKLIDFGLSTDFQESTNISSGVRYNIGSFIPLIQDLYIGIHYGYNFGKDKTNPVIMLGTTL